ncbi:MAG: hypothetical protein IKF14_13750 [Atopobiaceae bacterium]|nr:hypothetical protein [Atopobiaceae bacterium]
MGGGTWSRSTYDRVTARKVSKGASFGYDRHAKSSGRYEAHDDLKVIVGGVPVTRESRDSDEHPESTPIVIGFDVTGSMGENPHVLQKSLKGLFGMLIRKDVVSDPQVAIGAYGDTHCDRVPVQLSQFESDNRIDDNLDNVFIEGCGGGNNGETSTALVWFVANHVVTDAWEKRGKRGYMFLVGDECALEVYPEESKTYLGESQPFTITPQMAFDKARERWDVYFLLVDNFSAQDQHSRRKYEALLGSDHVVTLETTDSAPAVIASIIGLAEGTVDSGELATELTDAGFDSGVALAAVKSATGIDVTKHGVGVAVADTTYGDLKL